MVYSYLRKILLMFMIFFGGNHAMSQTLYLPGGATDIGDASTQNVGIGTSAAPAEKLHVAGNIQIGAAEPSTPSAYYINMPAGSGTIGGGNGRSLVISAGSSDNQSTVRGGHLYLRPGVPVSPSTTYGNVLLADEGGKVGIGPQSPQAFLDISPYLDVNASPGKLGIVLGRLQEGSSAGDGTFLGVRGYGTSLVNFSGKSFALEHNFYGITNSSINFHRGGSTTGGYLTFNTNDNTERMRILGDGRIGIGTVDPGSCRLAVEGKIGAREVVVTTEGWADYVFENTYNLRPLSEVESYIKENKHLPEIPSAKEVEQNGVNLGEMNMLLLKKVEELTLYLIELKKENIDQRKQNERLQSKIESILQKLNAGE